jgi:hypothetical protein
MAVARAGPRLEVWRTVEESYALTFRNLGYLLRISWAWVGLMIPVSLAYYASIGWHDSLFHDVLSALLFQPFLASIAVAWHRRLLANDVWPPRVYLRLDGLVASYLGLSVVILILFPGPMLVVSPDFEGFEWYGVLAVALATGLGLFVSTKIWLALPARALGNSEITVRKAWKRSRWNVWRLIAGSILCGLPMLVLLMLTAMFAPDFTEASQPLIYAAWQTLLEIGITFLAGMPILSFLSLAYRRLIRDREPADLLRST